MRRLVTLCLTYNGAVTVATLLALVFGVWGATRAPLDVFPDFVPAQVDIQTEAPGFSSEQVEELVTKKIESSVNGAPGLASIRSESIPGLSVVTISFVDGIDLYNARQGVSEKLSEIAGELPAGVAVPKLSPLVSSTMDLLKIGLVSDKVGPFELHDLATWLIKPKLSAVPGVAHVIVFGGAERGSIAARAEALRAVRSAWIAGHAVPLPAALLGDAIAARGDALLRSIAPPRNADGGIDAAIVNELLADLLEASAASVVEPHELAQLLQRLHAEAARAERHLDDDQIARHVAAQARDRADEAMIAASERWGERARLWGAVRGLYGDLGEELGTGWDLGTAALRHAGWMPSASRRH